MNMKKNLNKKKILLISNMYPSKKFPHYGVFVRNSEEILLKEGYEVKRAVIAKSNSKIVKLIRYIMFYLKIILKILFVKYDAIYAHYASHTALPLILVKKIKPNIKIVMNVHGNDIVPEDEHDYKFIPLVKKILKKSSVIVAPSLYFKEILIEEYKCEENNIIVYPSGGVNTKKFKKTSMEVAKGKMNLNNEKKYIGYVSRIEKDKGWDIFLKAISIIKDDIPENVQFLIIGSGSEEKKYNELVNELDIESLIIKKSYLDQKELVYAYNSLDLFCFPTYRKSESLGLVGLEAMACEKIVLASNFGGPKTYIKEDNGFLFNYKDEHSLAKQIKKIMTLSDKEKRVIEQKARETALQYDQEKTKKILLGIFADI